MENKTQNNEKNTKKRSLEDRIVGAVLVSVAGLGGCAVALASSCLTEDPTAKLTYTAIGLGSYAVAKVGAIYSIIKD